MENNGQTSTQYDDPDDPGDILDEDEDPTFVPDPEPTPQSSTTDSDDNTAVNHKSKRLRKNAEMFVKNCGIKMKIT